MSQDITWPPAGGGGSGSNASVGTVNITAPTSATEIAGVDSGGILRAVSVDSSGNENVNVLSSSLPTGAATAALQTTGNTTLTTISTTTGSILLDLTNGTQITQITGTVPLPTGAATSALQTTGNTSLSTIATNTGTIATNTGTIATNTTGVSTAANQTTGNTSLATIATNSGTQATAANQTTGNTSLSTIATNTTRQGTLTDDSGTTSGTPSTSTTVMASNASRKYLLIQNLDSTNNIYINFTSAASNGTGSYTLLPYGTLVQEGQYVSTEAVTVLATVASIKYSAKQG